MFGLNSSFSKEFFINKINSEIQELKNERIHLFKNLENLPKMTNELRKIPNEYKEVRKQKNYIYRRLKTISNKIKKLQEDLEIYKNLNI